MRERKKDRSSCRREQRITRQSSRVLQRGQETCKTGCLSIKKYNCFRQHQDRHLTLPPSERHQTPGPSLVGAHLSLQLFNCTIYSVCHYFRQLFSIRTIIILIIINVFFNHDTLFQDFFDE